MGDWLTFSAEETLLPHPFEKASAHEVVEQKMKNAAYRIPPPGEHPDYSKTYHLNEGDRPRMMRHAERLPHFKVDMPVHMLTPGNSIFPERMARMNKIGGSSDRGFTEIDRSHKGDPVYTVEDGNHRVAHAKATGKSTVPMFVRPNHPDDLARLHSDIQKWHASR